MRFPLFAIMFIGLTMVLAVDQTQAQNLGDSTSRTDTSQQFTSGGQQQMVFSPSMQTFQAMQLAPANELAIPDEDIRLQQMALWMAMSGGQAQAMGGGIGDYNSGSEQEYPYAPLTSMSEVAALFNPPAQATKLFLNFEGKTAQWDHVLPFEATTGDRERDIQEIMFYVSQTFAPFNVKVQRFVGNSQQAESGGHTTIFIGDKISNSIYMESDSGHSLTNNKRAYADADYPCLNRSVTHQPNSDEYNLGYVDPISFKEVNSVDVEPYDSNDNDQIARAINHEAGHTFGLAHVLTGNIPDIMSYSAMNQRAHYQEFNLSALNSSLDGSNSDDWGFVGAWTYEIFVGGGQTQLVAHYLKTQNSYRVLESTLGTRSVNNDISNIANQDLVHGVYPDASPMSIDKEEMFPSEIEHQGDYDVVDFTPNTTEFVEVDAVAWDDPVWFDPILMVFNEQGDALIAYDRNSGNGKDSRLVFEAVLGESYKIVVGSYNCSTFGGYQLSVDSAEFTINPNLGGGGELKVQTNPTHQALGGSKTMLHGQIQQKSGGR